jgi:hypothetical protein
MLLSACSEPPATQTESNKTLAPDVQAAAAIASATALLETSREAGHAWTPTRTQLDAAAAALAAGDFAAATAHADRAAALASASLDQAEAETNAWASRFPTRTSEK